MRSLAKYIFTTRFNILDACYLPWVMNLMVAGNWGWGVLVFIVGLACSTLGEVILGVD